MRRVCVVPGTSKGRYSDRGSFNVLAFQDSSVSSPPQRFVVCDVVDCKSRHHDKDFQLFCSSVRETDTAYMVPYVFAEGRAFGWLLTKRNERDSTIPAQEIVGEYVCDIASFKAVPFRSVRGVCMATSLERHHRKRVVFVFRGRQVFGYDT